MTQESLSALTESFKLDVYLSVINRSGGSLNSNEEIARKAFEMTQEAEKQYLEYLGETLDDIEEEDFELGAEAILSIISGYSGFRTKASPKTMIANAIAIHDKFVELYFGVEGDQEEPQNEN